MTGLIMVLGTLVLIALVARGVVGFYNDWQKRK